MSEDSWIPLTCLGFWYRTTCTRRRSENENSCKALTLFFGPSLSYRETNFPAGRRNFIFFFFQYGRVRFFFLSRNGCNRVCVRIYNPCSKQSQTRHQTQQSQWLEAFVWPLSRLLLDRKKTSGGELDVSRSSRPNESPPTDQTFAYYMLGNGEERKKEKKSAERRRQ